MVQRGGDWASPPRPFLAVPNVTAHPSTASVPVTVLLYKGPLLCGFNVPFKGLSVYCCNVVVLLLIVIYDVVSAECLKNRTVTIDIT